MRWLVKSIGADHMLTSSYRENVKDEEKLRWPLHGNVVMTRSILLKALFNALNILFNLINGGFLCFFRTSHNVYYVKLAIELNVD